MGGKGVGGEHSNGVSFGVSEMAGRPVRPA